MALTESASQRRLTATAVCAAKVIFSHRNRRVRVKTRVHQKLPNRDRRAAEVEKLLIFGLDSHLLGLTPSELPLGGRADKIMAALQTLSEQGL